MSVPGHTGSTPLGALSGQRVVIPIPPLSPRAPPRPAPTHTHENESSRLPSQSVLCSQNCHHVDEIRESQADVAGSEKLEVDVKQYIEKQVSFIDGLKPSAGNVRCDQIDVKWTKSPLNPL